MEDSHSVQDRSDQDEKRSRRDLLLALLLLFLGLICLCCTAELAVRPSQTWQVSANMLSEITLVADGGQAIRVAPVGTKALTPFPESFLTPQGTPSPAPPGVIGELPTTTPTRQVAVVPTAAATDTPIPPSPTNTATPAPPPTATFTPSPTPTFTPFPTFTFTPIPVPTNTSAPPTDTPIPGPTDTPTATPTDTPIPPPPTVLSITPNSGYNDVDVNVVIGGADFMDPPTVYLGANALINVTWINANTINATVPAGLAPGVYALTVTNPDLQSDTLPAAYTVLAPPIPPPTVLSITPNSGYNDVDVNVVIGGADFMDPPTVYLGANALINVTWINANTINATVPAGLTPGVYALTVTNPDLQSDTLPAAYTVLAPSDPNTTLENAQLLTAGNGAAITHGDDDFVQVIFFEIPTSYGGGNPVYFRIYDADTGGGGGGETIDQMWNAPWTWNTSMRYTAYGGSGAYTGAQASHPTPAQIASGTQLDQTTIGAGAAGAAYHDNWGLVFGPYTANQGEAVSTGWVFKLVVEGLSGDDGNGYQVAVSTDAGSNTAPAGSRIFAYCWTFTFTTTPPQPPFYPHLPAGTSTFEQYNLDFDDVGSSSMTLHTPLQDLSVPASGISGVGVVASSSHLVGTGEDDATWTVDLDIQSPFGRNNASFWATGDGGDLAIFTQPTTSPAP